MKFYSATNKERPKRLSDETREYAKKSLEGFYGKKALENMAVSLDAIEKFDVLTEQQKYDVAITEIVKQAELGIDTPHLLVGSATLGMAIGHSVPATYDEKVLFSSVSHVTLGFDKVLQKGLNHYENELKKHLEKEENEVLLGMKNVIDAIKIWHKRYMDELDVLKRDNKCFEKIYNNLKECPFNPPQNFYQAVQALWFLFSFTRLCGNWSGIGRIDEMLGHFLEKDLESGKITIDEAREILAHFLIKGCEWISLNQTISGDAQHYQNIVLAGVDENGKDITNSVTRLVLEVLEELPISDYPVAVRVNSQTPQGILELVARNMKHGGGVVAVYNEELVLESMERFGYSTKEARRFANDGCWEVQIPGETCFSYYPFDGYFILQSGVMKLSTNESPMFESFEALYEEYKNQLGKTV